MTDFPGGDLLHLLDWKRRVFGIYAETRAAADPEAAWKRWLAVRDELFATHPQSPLPATNRRGFTGLAYFAYEPRARVLAEVVAAKDFNFAYNPSCAYDPRWVCPLVPAPNRLAVPIRAGERYG